MPDPIIKENQFWLQVLGDYSRFMRNTIYVTAADEINRSIGFITQLDELLARSRLTFSDEQLKVFNQQAYQAVQDFRKFILSIIRKQITEKNIIVMTPAILNEYVNDTERYLDILDTYMKNNTILNPVSDSITWLMKIYIGTMHLQDSIGISFIEYKRKAGALADIVLDLYLRAYVTIGLRRTNLRTYPALEQLMVDIQSQMTVYAEYLVDLIRLLKEKKLLGSITLLDLDNQYRQLCYYLTKLSMFSEIRPPVCDPTSPRESE
jgi:hypothetical protein